MIRISALNRYLFILALGAIGIACGLLASTVGYAGRFNIVAMNYQYSALGWFLRTASFLIGVSTVALSWRGNPLIPAQRHHGLGFLLGMVCIFWEIATIAMIIGFILLAICGIGS
jgi:hypothetical protein